MSADPIDFAELQAMGRLLERILEAEPIEPNPDNSQERDRRGRLRWLREDGTRP